MDNKSINEIAINNASNNQQQEKTPPATPKTKTKPPSRMRRDIRRSARFHEEKRKKSEKERTKETSEAGTQTDMTGARYEKERKEGDMKIDTKVEMKEDTAVDTEADTEVDTKVDTKVGIIDMRKTKKWEKVWKYCTKGKHPEREKKEKKEERREEDQKEEKVDKHSEKKEEEEKARTSQPTTDAGKEETLTPISKVYENFEINMRLSRLEEEKTLTTALRHIVRNTHEKGRTITFPTLEEVDRIQLKGNNLPTDPKELTTLIDQVFKRRGEIYSIEQIYRQFVMIHGRITFDSKLNWPASHIYTRHP